MEKENVMKWEDLRNQAAIAAMQGTITILSSSDRCAFREVVVEGFRGEQKTYPNEIAQFSVAVADALINELKCSSADEVDGNKDKEWAMSVLDFKITNCALSIRTMNLLKSAGIDTIGELIGFSKYDLLKNVNFGKKSVGEIEDFLAGIGLKLKGE